MQNKTTVKMKTHQWPMPSTVVTDRHINKLNFVDSCTYGVQNN